MQLNDVGTLLRVIIQENNSVKNLAGITSSQIVLRKPSGSTLTKSSVFGSNGSDGIITYTTESGDIDEIGIWRIQGVITSGSAVFYSEVEEFTVNRNI